LNLSCPPVLRAPSASIQAPEQKEAIDSVDHKKRSGEQNNPAMEARQILIDKKHPSY